MAGNAPSSPVRQESLAGSPASPEESQPETPAFVPEPRPAPPFDLRDGETTPEENRWYQENYLEPLLHSGLFLQFFDNQYPFPADTHFAIFQDLVGKEEWARLQETYGERIPQEIVEGWLTAYLEATPEEFRTWYLKELYHPEDKAYSPPESRWDGKFDRIEVVSGKRAGDTLALVCKVSFLPGADDPHAPYYYCETTIREYPGGWRYAGNTCLDIKKQNDLSSQGTVSGDGLTYRNDAAGFAVTLPPSATGRPWHFVPSEPLDEGDEGMCLYICYTDDPRKYGEFGVIQVLSHERLEELKKEELFQAECSDEWRNSRWAFAVTTFRQANPFEGTSEADTFLAMLREIQQGLESGLSFYEPTV